MLGSGVDGHVAAALGKVVSKHLLTYWAKQHKNVPTVYCSADGSNTLSDVPTVYPAAGAAPRELRHCRFACPGAVAAAALGWTQADDEWFCTTCPRGKVIKTDANRALVDKEQRCGALLCGDILGPFTKSKTHCYQYCAVFIDAYSHMTHTYPMVHKSEFTAAFEHVCTTYSAAGHPVTSFMTDTDSVMTSDVFRDTAVALNVCLRYSSPYCHWQNGVIERFVYSVKNKTICNLYSSGLPQCWWYPALRHASDTYNATPTRTNPCQASPRDVWHGKLSVGVDGKHALETRCDESFRRAFGCCLLYTSPSPRD